MKNWLLIIAALFFLGMNSPLSAQEKKTDLDDLLKSPIPKDGKKGEEPKAPEKKPADKEPDKKPAEKFTYGSKFIGTVKQMDKGGGLTIEVTQTYQVPNASGYRELQKRKYRIMQLQFQIQRERNPHNRNRKLQELARLMRQKPPKLVDVKTHKFDVPIKTGEKI